MMHDEGKLLDEGANGLIKFILYSWRDCSMKCSKCKRPWLYFGIITGFLTGFLYFAYGIYTHGSSRSVSPYRNTSIIYAGTTIPRGYE